MDLWAATEASATSGWFEGWVGGLIAAAVTLAFTAWWETRQHRRRQLDDALIRLSEACTEYWNDLERVMADLPAPDIAEHAGRVMTAEHHAGMLAARRVLGLPVGIMAPCRGGLHRTLDVLGEMTSDVHKPGDSPDLKGARRVALAEIATATRWIHNPWQFAWNRDLSESVLSGRKIRRRLK
ncbi:hypothetical protein AB0O99_04075 [Cellulosimicrobium funkei]|uniref:hypothetical protein n=1 Tax=Cellulosimicrobium funkei TaxID=264251 RepID=UPI003426DC41